MVADFLFYEVIYMPRGDNPNSRKNLERFGIEKEARENGIKGGKASVESRRRRKTLKETLLLLLEDETVQDDIALALIREARKGNNAGSVTKAFEVIRDTIGEKPVDKIQIAEVDASTIADVESIFNG